MEKRPRGADGGVQEENMTQPAAHAAPTRARRDGFLFCPALWPAEWLVLSQSWPRAGRKCRRTPFSRLFLGPVAGAGAGPWGSLSSARDGDWDGRRAAGLVRGRSSARRSCLGGTREDPWGSYYLSNGGGKVCTLSLRAVCTQWAPHVHVRYTRRWRLAHSSSSAQHRTRRCSPQF